MNKKKLILIADDEIGIHESLRVYLTREGRSAAAGYAACFGPLCRRMQEALGLEEDACQTAACAILAQSQDRLPQLRDRLTAE